VHSQYNGRRIPSLELSKPSEELAYVIGVVLGDGYPKLKRRVRKVYNDVIIRLEAKDKEFVEEFARCLAKVLGRRQIRPRYVKSSGRYVVEAESKTLYELLKKPVGLERLRRYIKHCERWVAAFLRGFADSEGCVDKKGYIFILNTDLRPLMYIMDLLRGLNIESMGPILKATRGTVIRDPKTGKQYVTNMDCYYIYIRASSNANSYKYIGFTIKRKQQHLEEYIKEKHKYTYPSPQPFPSHSTYSK
jgi:intein-encoded DNA endonuclease-like protein